MTAPAPVASPGVDWTAPVHAREVAVPLAAAQLSAVLYLPPSSRGAVVVGHPSGICRLSSRERFGATVLARAGFATLLVDLVSEEEDCSGPTAAADVPLLADRFLACARWLSGHRRTSALPVGFVGVDAAAAAALVASASDPAGVFAVVTRGGHPERAAVALRLAPVPTLFLAASGAPVDAQDVAAQLTHGGPGAPRRLAVLPSPSGDFSEGDAFDQVLSLGAEWLSRWVGARPPRPGPGRSRS